MLSSPHVVLHTPAGAGKVGVGAVRIKGREAKVKRSARSCMLKCRV